MRQKLTVEQSTLLKLLGNALFQHSSKFGEKIDWNSVYWESCQQTVELLVSSCLPGERIPDDLYKLWQTESYQVLMNNIRVENEHIELHRIMEENHIPYVILKGSASASYYTEPVFRNMGDVDFLVDPSDLEKAEAILKAHGFVSWEEKHRCHVVYKKGDAHLELHFEPPGIPEGNAGELVRDYLSDTISSAIVYETDNGIMKVPDLFHHGLILLLHMVHHLTGEGIGLRHLCDWAVFANHLSDIDFCQLFKDKLQAIGLWKFTCIMTHLCIRYLGMPPKPWAEEYRDEELTEQLIHDIFAGGNFGKKDQERSNEAYLISSRGKHGVGRQSILSQTVVSMNEAVYTHMPITKKKKYLLPAGWIIVGTRQLLLIVTGKRKKMHVLRMIKGAGERRNIYGQLDIFQG